MIAETKEIVLCICITENYICITEKSSEILVLQDHFSFYFNDERPSSPLSYTHAVAVKSLVFKRRAFDPCY